MFASKGNRIQDSKYWPLDMDKNVSKSKKGKNKVDSAEPLEGAAFIDFFAKMGETLKETR